MTFFFVTFPNAGELNYLVNPAFQKAEAESYWFSRHFSTFEAYLEKNEFSP